MGDEVSSIDYSIPVYEPEKKDSPQEDDELQASEESSPAAVSPADKKTLTYSSPGQASKTTTSQPRPDDPSISPEQRLTDSITQLERRIQAERGHLTARPTDTDQSSFISQLQRSSPVHAVRFSARQSSDRQASSGLAERTRQNEIILEEAQRLQGLGRTEEAQRLIDEPGRGNAFVRIHDLRAGLTESLDANTEEITRVQTALDQLEQSRERLDPITRGFGEAHYARQKEAAEDHIAGQLGIRTHQLRVMMEANELVEAGRYQEAEALLNGSTSFAELSESRLHSSNPSAARQTHPDGSEKTDEEVVSDTRTALQETINANRAGLDELQGQIAELTDTINGKAPKAQPDPFGIMPQPEAPNLTTDQKLQLMEQRNLLRIQQDRLREETERLFAAHDGITEAANAGDLSRARDIAEGRQAVLAQGERLTRPTSLSERQFARTPEEELEYQAAAAQLAELHGTGTQLNSLIRGDSKDKEGGLEFKISDTQRDIDQSGVLSWIGGRTDSLRTSLGAERANKKELEQLEDVVSTIQSRAQDLITQGRYQEAEQLLQTSNEAISDGFQASNKKLQAAYKGANEQLEQFDRNLKDFAVQGVKVVAMTSVAMALAPATGGGSLAALTALGTGTFAAVGAGVAIDSVDAAINMGAFDESFAEAGSRVVSRENMYNNFKTAFSAALAGSSGAQIFARLEKFGALAATAGSAGGASALVTTANLTEQRIQAELAYKEALRSNPDLDKGEFMEERGVSASQLAKAFAIDTGTGILSGLVGLRANGLKEAAKTGLAKGAIEVGEEGANVVLGLTAAHFNDDELTAESIRDELMAATAGNRASRYASRNAEARRARTEAAGDAQQRRNTPVTETINPEQSTSAATTVEVDSATGARRASQSYDSAETRNDPRIKAEEDLHAKETIIDPGKVDPETGAAPMDLAEYQARRALREAVAQQAADAQVATQNGTSTSEAKQAHKQRIKDIGKAIAAGDYDGALSLARDSGYINERYLDQYQQDYQHNTNPDNVNLRQVSFSSKKDTGSPETSTATLVEVEPTLSPTGSGRTGYDNLMQLTGGKVYTGTSEEPFSVPLEQLRFTHDEINPNFGNLKEPGPPIWKLVNNLLTEPDYGKNNLKPLRVVKIGENDYLSLDNRRLGAHILASQPEATVRWATADEINNELLWRFTSTSEGLWATLRGSNEEIVVPR
ncbi:MAG: hypothetical protein OXU45_02340 [Candidatus Melainabacteria bacterium]|nr:hypothetical protein [Candidatus Melainabacteria bacterium]